MDITEIKPITVKEFIEAIRKNGLPRINGQYYKMDGDTIIGACAVGQARINLGLTKMEYPIDTPKRAALYKTPIGSSLEDTAVSLNDSQDDYGGRLTFDDIADRLLRKYESRLNELAYAEYGT